MSWFSSVFNDLVGNKQGPVYSTGALDQAAIDQAAIDAAAQTPAPVTPTPVTPTPAPVTPTPAPVTPVSTFDPTPFRSSVDSSFSQFTPEFYAKKFQDTFNPWKTGVDNQYNLARDALTAGVAKKGLSNSSQGQGLFQQLDALRDQAYNTGQSAAQGFQSTLTSDVQKAKDDLYGSIGEGKDNASVGGKAATAASGLAGRTGSAGTLGDIFGGLVSPYANANTPGGPVNPDTQAFATGGSLNLANPSGGPSTKVVGATKKKF